MTLYIKGLQNYGPSKFEQLDFSPFTIQTHRESELRNDRGIIYVFLEEIYRQEHNSTYDRRYMK